MKLRAAMCLLGLAVFALPSSATTRAWLDRAQAASGQAVTLNIETDQMGANPDFSALDKDFQVIGRNSGQQWSMLDGQTHGSLLIALVLQPRREGALAIPALRIGGDTTPPLRLDVRAATPASANDPNAKAFIETEVDDANPYVQQSVGVTVRLYYAVPLQTGQLDLDAPLGASLQRVGDDVQSQRDVHDRHFNVVERHYLLVADHSGPLALPAARFSGQGVGGFFDDMFGKDAALGAVGTPRTLNVRAQPDNAPQPWLPLRDLQLKYLATPQNLRAGEAATLTVQATALGATKAQMPELPTPSAPGAQVFADPVQYAESLRGGVPQVTATRRYSLVPEGSGELHVAGLRMGWWDVQAGAAKTATLPNLDFHVAPGSGGFSNRQLPSVPVATAAAPGASNLAPASPPLFAAIPVFAWPLLAVAFALLWLLTLAWALRRRPRAAKSVDSGATADGVASNATQAIASRANSNDLRKALDTGSLDDVGDALRAMHAPPLADLDALIVQLDDAIQRDAIEQLRRARWAGGDGSAARAALRAAFKSGPKWKAQGKPGKPVLSPLYPR